MIVFVAERVLPSSGSVVVPGADVITSGPAAPGAISMLGAMFADGSGATTVLIVGLSSPQSIDQFPSAIAEDANNFTTNMLTTARKSANNAYHSSRHGR